MVVRGALAAVIIGILVGAGPALPATARADLAEVTVFAGTGQAVYGGDGGPAALALLANPTGVAVAADGTVFIGDSTNRRVRAVRPDGTIVTVAGSGRAGDRARPVTGPAPATGVDLSSPQRLAVGRDGTLYLADPGLLRVFALSTDGRLSVAAGVGSARDLNDGGPAVGAGMGEPRGLAVAADGTVYVADFGNRRVRAVSPSGVITTVAGTGSAQATAAGGPAARVAVPGPDGLAVDGAGTLWIVDGQTLRRVRGDRMDTVTYPDGRWATSDVASWPPPQPALVGVSAVAASGDQVYTVNQATGGVYRLRDGGSMEQVADLRGVLPGPSVGQLAVAPSGTVYLADVNSHRVYMFRPAPPGGVGSGDRAESRWPFLAGGALAVVVVVAVGWWLSARRRPGA